MTVQERVRRFIVENFWVSEPAELTDDTPLVQSGIVDSTGMLELVAFLEETLGTRIGDDETTPENLGTIAAIAAFAARKTGGGPRVETTAA
jgi:acyl carrier protein